MAPPAVIDWPTQSISSREAEGPALRSLGNPGGADLSGGRCQLRQKAQPTGPALWKMRDATIDAVASSSRRGFLFPFVGRGGWPMAEANVR